MRVDSRDCQRCGLRIPRPKAPPGERLCTCACPSQLSGVLVDSGTGRRIPFPVWFDPDTGEYEAIKVAANGVDMACDEDYRSITYRARAQGQLKLLPFGQAASIGQAPPPKQVVDAAFTAERRMAGLEQYKRVYHEVWRWRGESRRAVDDRWDDFIAQSDFLDHFVLRRRSSTVR